MCLCGKCRALSERASTDRYWKTDEIWKAVIRNQFRRQSAFLDSSGSFAISDHEVPTLSGLSARANTVA
jgi:hypothetical protein